MFDEDGKLVNQSEDDVLPANVRENGLGTGDGWSHQRALIGRFGVLVNLTPRIDLRRGCSCLISYLDEPLSEAIEVGLG